MIYGKNLTAIITEEYIDNTSNIEVIDLINFPLKVQESVKWFVLYTERLTIRKIIRTKLLNFQRFGFFMPFLSYKALETQKY